MNLKPGDIILFGGKGGILGTAILKVMNWFQSDPVVFYHAAIVADENEGLEAGLRIQRFDLKDRLMHAEKFKVIRMKNITSKQCHELVKTGDKLLGIKYGYSRLILQLFDQIFKTNFFTHLIKDNKYHVCSSLVAWLFYTHAGKVKFNGSYWRSCEPDDIDDEALRNTIEWEVIAKK
jgi:hypothetical protein